MSNHLKVFWLKNAVDLRESLCLYSRLPARGPFHEPQYLSLLARRYGCEAVLWAYESPRGAAYFPCLLRSLSDLPFAQDSPVSARYDMTSSWYYGGPLLAPSPGAEAASLAREFARELEGAARREGVVCAFVRFDPNLSNHLPFAEVWGGWQARPTVYVGLGRPETELFIGLRGRCRTAIRKAMGEGVSVRPAEAEEDWAAFARIYAGEMERKGADPHYRFGPGFFVGLRQAFGPRAGLLMAAYRGETAGGTICVHGDGLAFDYLSASLPAVWGSQINNLMIYEAILWAKRAGCRTYDLMGGRPGVLEFKRGFSRTERPFHTASVVFDPEGYRDLCVRWEAYAHERGKEPRPGYFPAYRQGFDA